MIRAFTIYDKPDRACWAKTEFITWKMWCEREKKRVEAHGRKCVIHQNEKGQIAVARVIE
jgi:hypothetical protein